MITPDAPITSQAGSHRQNTNIKEKITSQAGSHRQNTNIKKITSQAGSHRQNTNIKEKITSQAGSHRQNTNIKEKITSQAGSHRQNTKEKITSEGGPLQPTDTSHANSPFAKTRQKYSSIMYLATNVPDVCVCVDVGVGGWVGVGGCVRACVRAWVRACVRACVCVYTLRSKRENIHSRKECLKRLVRRLTTNLNNLPRITTTTTTTTAKKKLQALSEMPDQTFFFFFLQEMNAFESFRRGTLRERYNNHT